MVVGGSRQQTLDPGFVLLGTRHQGVPVILRELVLPGGFDLVSPSFTVRDVTTESPSDQSIVITSQSYRRSVVALIALGSTSSLKITGTP
ncbi:unnamed protein product [Schistosoma margrebowiei]|uniref:Uncharacterized protein n=1 Tax=Schistosoma margrebowiei TaxID=48269 RepID=A0A183M131_9TREM|nr:unnamed protein product [Schistosoma margrebowiei]